jgi:predicted nuclease with TOPRIM domain
MTKPDAWHDAWKANLAGSRFDALVPHWRDLLKFSNRLGDARRHIADALFEELTREMEAHEIYSAAAPDAADVEVPDVAEIIARLNPLLVESDTRRELDDARERQEDVSQQLETERRRNDELRGEVDQLEANVARLRSKVSEIPEQQRAERDEIVRESGEWAQKVNCLMNVSAAV